ncbi:hypothetical protein [Fusobacterium polymorphum]|uniref:hypothetical protein n=1 Tax=Fusobacterium nucleatum subsp. polymorphum TaxID=76857 RepID=UPI002B4BABAB|nr:hypothetical protein [Fusobacterium polymorphum]WRL70262.1 hypothetical protein VKN81_08940 [Fusobacterium polymorphum]
MKIYLTTENGAYIAEIDRLLYKNIAEILGNKKKEGNFSKQQLEANKLEKFFEEKIITLSKKDSIDKYIEKKLKKYFFQILQILENENSFYQEEEIEKLKKVYSSLNEFSIEDWKRSIKEVIEKKLKRENFYYLDFDVEDIFFKKQNEEEVKVQNEIISNFILEKDELISNFESFYNNIRYLENFKYIFNIPFYFPIVTDFYFLTFIFGIFKEEKINILIKDDIQNHLYNILKKSENMICKEYKEIINKYNNMDDLQKKLIIVHIVSIFENFMKEFFSKLIIFDNKYFVRVLEKNQPNIDIPKKLEKIPNFANNLMKELQNTILETTFHNIDKVNNYLKIFYSSIEKIYDTGLYYNFIKFRNFVCHRAGKDENNEELEIFSLEELEKNIKNIKNIINSLLEAIKIEE